MWATQAAAASGENAMPPERTESVERAMIRSMSGPNTSSQLRASVGGIPNAFSISAVLQHRVLHSQLAAT